MAARFYRFGLSFPPGYAAFERLEIVVFAESLSDAAQAARQEHPRCMGALYLGPDPYARCADIDLVSGRR